MGISSIRRFLIAGCILAVALPAAAEARTLYSTTTDGKLISYDDNVTKVKSVKYKKKNGKQKKVTKTTDVVQVDSTRTIVGLPAGVSLRGIDFRPKTGELVGVGSDSVVYKVVAADPKTARVVSAGAITTPLAGSSFGVDFNPVPDAIRIVSDTGQNLRITALGTQTAGLTTPTTNVDGALNPGTPSIVGAGYSNSGFSDAQPAAGQTTLFTVDSTSNTLNTQGSPGGAPTNPNTGTQIPVAPLGVDIGTSVGFDVTGSFATPAGLLVDNSSGKSTLYKVNLTTGVATKVGDIATVTTTKKKKKKKTNITNKFAQASTTGLAAVQD